MKLSLGHSTVQLVCTCDSYKFRRSFCAGNLLHRLHFILLLALFANILFKWVILDLLATACRLI